MKKILIKPPPLPPKQPLKRRFPWVLLAAALFSLWFVWGSITPNLPRKGDAPKLYSNQCQQDIRATLLAAIRKASSIYLVMFGLSDKAILSALKEKIQQNIPTKIYYDVGGSPKIFRFLRGGDIHPIKDNGLMHQKIIVLDDSMVFIGSANMTTSSLKMHDNLVLGFVSQPVAKFLQEHEPFTPGYFQTKFGKQDLELWLLPDPRGHALAHLRKKIRNAKKSIRIALFTFTHQSLIDEVIEAKERGINVSVIIDKHSSLGASAKTVTLLERAGVSVKLNQGNQLLHHKFIYIDEEMLVMGSANWTKAAFYKNSDCILSLSRLNPEQKKFMNNLWDRIESKTISASDLDFRPSFH